MGDAAMTLPTPTPLTDARECVYCGATLGTYEVECGSSDALKCLRDALDNERATITSLTTRAEAAEAELAEARHRLEVERDMQKVSDAFSPTRAESAEADLKRAREALAWQPIETAPKDGTWVLLWSASDESVWTGLWRDRELLPATVREIWPDLDGKWCKDIYVAYDREHHPYQPIHEVTHWMPAPARPSLS